MEKDRVELKHFSSLLEKRSKAVAALKTGQGKDFMTEHFGELHALSKGWAEEVEEMSMSWHFLASWRVWLTMTRETTRCLIRVQSHTQGNASGGGHLTSGHDSRAGGVAVV